MALTAPAAAAHEEVRAEERIHEEQMPGEEAALPQTGEEEQVPSGERAAGQPLVDGSKVVIYNPANQKALSGTYQGFYNKGTDLTVADGKPTGYSSNDVWTVKDNGDQTWSFSSDGKNIGMGKEFSSMPLGAEFDKWTLEEAPNGLYYVKNQGRSAYMQWFESKGTWSAYDKIKPDQEGNFALAFHDVTNENIPAPPTPPSVDVPIQNGDQVVLYNVGAQGTLAGQDDNPKSPSIHNIYALQKDTKVITGNGGRVFTVEQNGEWWRFKTEHDGYLCSKGKGNNAYYDQTASDNADWKLEKFNDGFSLMSRTAKYNNTKAQYLEYFSGSYKTYSLSSKDKNIFTFQFYPVDSSLPITEGVVNLPSVVFGELPEAHVGQDYTTTFAVDAVFGVQTLQVRLGGEAIQPVLEGSTYTLTLPAQKLTAGEMELTVQGTDTKGVPFTGTAKLTVLDEPVITAVSPVAGAQTGENKQPDIRVTFVNAKETPAVKLTLKGPAGVAVNEADMTVSGDSASYKPVEALTDGRHTATVTVTRTDGKTVSRSWSFTIGSSQYQLYFGQLHSHTGEYSDGAGTLQEGLDHVAALPESANVDFISFTDHSNYFDTTGAANPEASLYDAAQMTPESKAKWDTYTSTVAAFNEKHAGNLVALAGFEMTWSGGPGHINTFNTPGLVSRNNKTLNNKTADAGLKAYYELLSTQELADSINQFNHPGSTFGTFSDFAHYDAIIDTRIHLVEVGNGEGAIGSGGYFPSYEYYIMALDKGWHVAPTNNQDNHKGKWGNANDARNVVLTNDFSQEGIYEAIRNHRLYATEDKNLEINYTLNDQILGSVIEQVPENARIQVNVHDPDASDSIAKVEVVVNTGKVAYTWDDPAQLASGDLACTIPAEYSYYFIRVIQKDGDIAVTAPVWVGETLKLGISSVECATSIPVTGETLKLKTTLFNSESSPAAISSIQYRMGDQVLDTQTGLGNVEPSSTQTVEWSYTPTTARLTTITVAVTLTQNGKEYTYTTDITLDVLDAERLVYIGIDASHFNEYVNGNYKDSMGNFSKLAAGYAVRTVELKTGEELKAACENQNGKYKAIILTAPSRRNGNDLREPYATYSDEEVQALKTFNASGGTVVLAGWSDYYENYKEFPESDHMAAQQNKILEALGSSLRISDDGTMDDERNGGQPQRLYFSTYNLDHFLMKGVEYDSANPNNNLYSQLFSQYGGASLYVVDSAGKPTATLPSTVSPMVYGHATTYSVDNDKVGLAGADVPKYPVAGGDTRLLIQATEQLPNQGLILVSGAAFMSNFEVQATVDSVAEKNYSNYNICENLVNYLNPITVSPISQVQAQKEEGVKYTIEGVVTSNASGYDKNTAFFDCIYVQDDTAGVNAFPVAGNFQVGDKVRITGTTSSYQGERQIAVTDITKIGTGTVPAPKEITAAQLNDRSFLGSLVTLKGTVVSYEFSNGLIQTILVEDSAGNVGRIFIDGYITKEKDVEGLSVGCFVTATGLASYDNSFAGEPARIRIRSRADVVCSSAPSNGGSSGSGSRVETTKNPDGSITTTVTRRDGTVTETTQYPDGSSMVVETRKDGKVTTTMKTKDGSSSTTVTEHGKTKAEVTLSAQAAAGTKPVKLPLPALSASKDGEKAPVITIQLPDEKKVQVEIPVEKVTYGTVVVLTMADGSQKILTDTIPTQKGVAVTLSNGDTVKLLDNAKDYNDVPKTQWSNPYIDFVSSRGLFQGTGEGEFSPLLEMTRGMVWTVLARLDGVDTRGGTPWYQAGKEWATTSGVSDGTNPEVGHTREQLVTMLWRYAGSPAATQELTQFQDSAKVSAWAKTAMAWAVEEGLVQGTDSGQLGPQLEASREQVAAILTRFIMNLEVK